jgi:SAM-dependent methyltransferase
VEAYPADYYTHGPAAAGPVARSIAAAKRSGLGRALGYVMYLQGMRPGRVLDVGCGNGSRLAELRARGWDVQGVGTLERDTFPQASFDAIVMTHVIEHMRDPLPVLRTCRMLLRPGGKLVVTCPNLDAYGHRRYGASWIALDAPRHEHLFTRASLIALSSAAGFTAIDARTSVRGAFGNFAGSEQVRASGRRTGRGGLALCAKALALMSYELVRLARDPLAGEEIALITS